MDAYVIVWPIETDESFNPNIKIQYIGGLGVYHETGLVGDTAVFTNCMLTVVDARTFKPIAQSRLHAGSGPIQGSIYTPVDVTFDTGDPARLSEQQKTRVKQVIRESVTATVRTMQLRR